jgi:hypothetical protein
LSRKQKNITIPILSYTLLFTLGYFMLEYSNFIKIPPGNTFYVVLGSLFLTLSPIMIFLIIKSRFFNRKKKKSKIFIINEKNKKKTINI